MPLANEKVLQNVQEVVAECLAITSSEVTLNAFLIDELGMDSLDFLDIVFALERQFKIKFRGSSFEQFLRLDGLIEEGDKGRIHKNNLKEIRPFLPALKIPENSETISVNALLKALTTETLTLAVQDRLDNNG